MGANILAIGMVSALGLDWETCCAASRCGISRAAKLDHYKIQAGDPYAVELVVGHQVDLLTRGFEGRGRLLQLLAGALRDLRRAITPRRGDVGSLPFYLSLPAPHRTLTNIEITLDEELREEMRAKRAEIPAVQGLEAIEALLSQAADLAQWPYPVQLAAVSQSGHTATIDILDQCLKDMASGRISHAIVGAVDSLLDDQTLAWLGNTMRLKHAALATGLVPGEAAVFFVLSAGQSEPKCLAAIERLAFDQEDYSLESGKSPRGKGLSNVLRKIAGAADWPGTDSPWMLSDHNGEAYRANDWGWALQRLIASNPRFGEIQSWFPAITFGDTGGASTAVGVACAAAAWKRAYAPSPRCCISASSDGGRCAALLVAKPPFGEAQYYG